jgi:hypothetical protein
MISILIWLGSTQPAIEHDQTKHKRRDTPGDQRTV